MGLGWGGADRGQVTEHRRQGDEKIAMVVESHPNVAEARRWDGAPAGREQVLGVRSQVSGVRSQASCRHLVSFWRTQLAEHRRQGDEKIAMVVESHPNVAEGATLGWGTRGGVVKKFKTPVELHTVLGSFDCVRRRLTPLRMTQKRRPSRPS
jgi:hypothetical protein